VSLGNVFWRKGSIRALPLVTSRLMEMTEATVIIILRVRAIRHDRLLFNCSRPVLFLIGLGDNAGVWTMGFSRIREDSWGNPAANPRLFHDVALMDF